MLFPLCVDWGSLFSDAIYRNVCGPRSLLAWSRKDPVQMNQPTLYSLIIQGNTCQMSKCLWFLSKLINKYILLNINIFTAIKYTCKLFTKLFHYTRFTFPLINHNSKIARVENSTNAVTKCIYRSKSEVLHSLKSQFYYIGFIYNMLASKQISTQVLIHGPNLFPPLFLSVLYFSALIIDKSHIM